MKIVYWSDYSCPYCYIGENRLKKVLDSIDERIDVEMKAFQLDPYCGKHATEDTQTRFANKYGISMNEAGQQIERISQIGISEGLDFKYATTLFTNTMDAHRLTKLAQSKKDQVISTKLIENLFKAYFTDNRELADIELLEKIGVESGLDLNEVRDVLNSDKFRDEVLKDEEEAMIYGIHGVPYFIIGEHGISGAQSYNGLKSTILRAIHREEKENKKLTSLVCGINGCKME